MAELILTGNLSSTETNYQIKIQYTIDSNNNSNKIIITNIYGKSGNTDHGYQSSSYSKGDTCGTLIIGNISKSLTFSKNSLISFIKDDYSSDWGIKSVTIDNINSFSNIKFTTDNSQSNLVNNKTFTGNFSTLTVTYYGNGAEQGTYNKETLSKEENDFVFSATALHAPKYYPNGLYNIYTSATDNVLHFSKKGYHTTNGKQWKSSSGLISSSETITYDENTAGTGLELSVMLGKSIEKSNQSIKLYTNWQPNVCTIYYNANGGEGKMGSQEFKYNSGAQLEDNTFIREAYEFTGWSTNTDGSGDFYTNKAPINNKIALTHNNSITLYAQWKQKTNIIKIKQENGWQTAIAKVKVDDTGDNSVDWKYCQIRQIK